MGFKTKQKYLTFSDLEQTHIAKKNQSRDTLEDMKKAITWDRIDAILLEDYPVGQSKEGNDAYPPIFLFKCLLLQKWFRIKFDTELESQINDRESFQDFLGLKKDRSIP